jgi:hypothetical protein
VSALFLVARRDGSFPQVVHAESAEAAMQKALARTSGSEIEAGVILAVWRLGAFPEQWHATYDRAPLTATHGSTGAKKIVKPLGRPRV